VNGERGSASVLVIGVVVIGLVLATAAARLGVALVARGRADTAADAAALAAADALALGRGTAGAKDAARTVAAANGARLVDCACGGRSALVTVEVPVGFPTAGPARATAKAEVRAACAVRAACT
jgi:secretion/DNA translocation related TadE-like protein